MQLKKGWILATLSSILLTVCCDAEAQLETPSTVPEDTSHREEPSVSVPKTHELQDVALGLGDDTLSLIADDEDCDIPDNVIPAPGKHCTERKQDEKEASNRIPEEKERVESSLYPDGGEIIQPQDGASDANAEDSQREKAKPVKITLQAFGSFDEDNNEESTEGHGREEQEGDVWTEQTEEGTEQKRTGGRRFFSLMNLIKFLLNPVIEEFQEVEKSSSSSDDSAAAESGRSAAAAASNNNKNSSSDVANASTVNSSKVAEKDEKKNGTDSGKKTKFQCVGRNVTENTTATVRVVNSTILLELLSFDKNHTTADCVLVMFYAPWCHFCAATAPHYNAVARAFPQLEVLAVDTVHFSNLNARFGTVAVPNIMLFHQSRSAVRFNHTERHFQTLLQFITNTTGLEANGSVELSPEDYDGPLSSTPTEETDYLLWFAWLFIIACSGYIFIYSQAGQRAIERVNVLWQEHQHQHIE
ncbi:thioredoxin domain-containing protein 15-like isoform X2 [Littorina saxatilis]|uniref:Thioredoxin domain-containing protein n=2 Tax=Littorina saxatilis TaxID=31220 RepID=A0AAN9BUQ5_9CAEN